MGDDDDDDDDDAIDFAGDGVGVDPFDAMPSIAPPLRDGEEDEDAPWIEAKEYKKRRRRGASGGEVG